MSAQENLAATRAGYEAFGKGDAATAMANMADDIEWIVPGDSSVSGTYHGKEEVGAFFMKLAEKSFVTQPHRFLADDDLVVVLTTVTADGRSSDQVDVYTYRDGKSVKFQAVLDTALQERIWGPK